jgi:hypothetical protein
MAVAPRPRRRYLLIPLFIAIVYFPESLSFPTPSGSDKHLGGRLRRRPRAVNAETRRGPSERSSPNPCVDRATAPRRRVLPCAGRSSIVIFRRRSFDGIKKSGHSRRRLRRVARTAALARALCAWRRFSDAASSPPHPNLVSPRMGRACRRLRRARNLRDVPESNESDSSPGAFFHGRGNRGPGAAGGGVRFEKIAPTR